MISIIEDKQLSWYDPEHDVIIHGNGAVDYRDQMLEDHLITLSNGSRFHFGATPGQVLTVDAVIDFCTRFYAVIDKARS